MVECIVFLAPQDLPSSAKACSWEMKSCCCPVVSTKLCISLLGFKISNILYKLSVMQEFLFDFSGMFKYSICTV